MSKQKEYRSLLTILAVNCPDECVSILKKYGEIPRFRNARDLEIKLAELYSKSNSKVDLEKDFANAHPHKNFILKYNKPKPIIKEVKVDNPIVIETPMKERRSQLEGGEKAICESCNDMFSSASNENSKKNKININTILIISAIGIAGLVTLAIYLRKK